MSTRVRADVFDALKASAERYGGIGGGTAFDNRAQPCCLLGHIARAEALIPDVARVVAKAIDPIKDPRDVSIGLANDEAVTAFNWRGPRKRNWNTRVPFDAFCAEMGWEREP